jgi:4-aminobutyrate aminotransferase
MGNIAPVWSHVTSLQVTHGEGSYVVTKSGERYLDFTSGIAVTSTGHAHPRVVSAIQHQASRFIHAQANCYTHDLMQPLCDLLDEVTPSSVDTFFFTNSGAEATEGAVKLAKAATHRPNVIVFDGSFHGRTHLTMAMTASKTLYRANFAPLPSGVFVAPFSSSPDTTPAALAALERILETQSAPSETACVVLELVQGEGGYRAADHRFVRGVERLCHEHGILLVIDEVQSGFGRTGRFFALEHYSVTPDIVIMAKGIASGFPFAAIGASMVLWEKMTPGSHGGTYGANPIGCAAALETIRVIRDEQLVENALERGAQLRGELKRLIREHGEFSLTGLGMMVGLSCPSVEVASKIRVRAQELGLLLMTAGGGSVIRFMPPLTVTASEMASAAEIFVRATNSVMYAHKSS